MANLLQLTHKGEFINMDHTDVLVGVLPFFHIYGLVVLMNLSYVPLTEPRCVFRSGVCTAHVAWLMILPRYAIPV